MHAGGNCDSSWVISGNDKQSTVERMQFVAIKRIMLVTKTCIDSLFTLDKMVTERGFSEVEPDKRVIRESESDVS